MVKNIKKIIGVLCSAIFCTIIAVGVPKMIQAAEVVEIDEINFPDEEFRNYIISEFDEDKDNELSENEIEKAIAIHLSEYGIKSLKGIEHFTNLQYLHCDSNKLTTLDVSKNFHLKHLLCRDNELTILDVSKNIYLESLGCDSNKLTTLDVSKNAYLEYLSCGGNKLTTLDVSKNTYLIYLYCEVNALTTLNLSNNTNLKGLDCSWNKLVSLNLNKNVNLKRLSCYENKLTTLDLSSNENLQLLACLESNQTMTKLKLNSKTHDKLQLYKGCIHGIDINLSDLQNVTETKTDRSYDDDYNINDEEDNHYYAYGEYISLIEVIDITKPATYKVNDKEFTITYTNISTSPISPVMPNNPFGVHIFTDYNYSNPATGSSVIYGNGKIKTIDGKKVNSKVFTAFTDITASYKHTLNNNGTIKSSVGKVIVGITKSDSKPAVSDKNKITDTSASKIAKAKIKNGQITVTAVGKEGGLVYLWVIDTGSKGVSACCPIDVKLAPKKMEVQNNAGTKIAKNTELKNGTSLDVCIAGFVGSTKTNDGTYTATVDSKYQSYVTVTPVQNSTDQFTITAKGLNNNKKTKVTITFQCDQNGKKTKFSLQLIE